MKRVKVSALRSKRGLRPVEQVAEPPVVGLTAPTTMMTERTDTMKSYLLRNSKAVEPQNPRPALAPASARGPALFIGLDVHNDSIAVSIAPGDSTEVRRYGIIGGRHDDVLSPLDG